MKVSFKLAFAYMKEQKGRTIALITCIALSVILVFSLNVIPETQSKQEIKEAYQNFSDYHVEYNNLNDDIVNKLKEDKDIVKINDILQLGKIVFKDGTSIQLNSYSDKFINSYGYKLAKGHNPKNSNEIVIEQKALKEMGLNDDLNQEINFKVVKYYVDKNNENQIFSKNKKFKLVGVLKKPDSYYEDSSGYSSENEYYEVKAFTKDNNRESILPNNLVTHGGTIYLNSSKPDIGKSYEITNKYGIDESNFIVNAPLIQVLDNYLMSKGTIYTMKQKLYPMLASTLVIFNIFSIVLIDMTKQIGILRSIGLSKNKVKFMIGIEVITVLALGIIAGFLIGILSSYIGFYIIYGKCINLYISKDSIYEPILMAFISSFISGLLITYKAGKISPIEAIRSSDKFNKKQKNRFHYKLIRRFFGFTGEMAYKNFWRNKIRTILCIISISLGGLLFIDTVAISRNEDKNLDKTTLPIMMMGNSDIKISHNYNNTDCNFTQFSKNKVEKISSIKGIKSINPLFEAKGLFITNSKDLTNEYKGLNGIGDENKNLEECVEIEGNNNESLKNLDKYIEKGKNIINNKKVGNIKALVSNYFYFQGATNTKLLNNIKLGDVINIKIPVIKNDKVEYKNEKIQVAGILNGDYVLREGGGSSYLKIVLNEDDFKNITGRENCNKLNIQIENENDKKVQSKIEKVIKNNSFSNFESKYNYKNYYTKQNEKNIKETIIVVALILIISSINVLCIIKANIMTRMKELATLRAIGMSPKKIKNMIIKENLMYAGFASVLASLIASYSIYKFIKISNEIRQDLSHVEKVVKFKLPVFESITFLIASIIMCLIAVLLCKKKIEKISIVEGLSTNE